MDENTLDDIGLDDAMLEMGIKEDDLVVINNDGSYVIIPLEIADILMSDEDFAAKIDLGFTDIDDFVATIAELYNSIGEEDNDDN